jgi:hypothetical protein
MKIYFLSNLIDDIKQSNYYNTKTVKLKERTIIKCCALVHIMHQYNETKTSLMKYNRVKIYSKMLVKLIGSDYKQIIDLLVEINYINADSRFSRRKRIWINTKNGREIKPNTERFWLTQKAMKCNLESFDLKDSKLELKISESLSFFNLDNEITFKEVKQVKKVAPSYLIESRPLF